MKISLLLLLVISYAFDDNLAYNFVTKYFDVPLDHFSFATNTTFKIRYLFNDSNYVSKGPIFFYTGNEGDISMFAQNTGFMFDIAKQFNALLIFAEHRYYGESLPFGNKSYDSPEYLGYLSSMQALADYVDLIDYLQKSYSTSTDLKRLPVVAFGGSYGGMLSSWLRMKYPSSVVGAIASSAPIWQFKDLIPCENFYKVTTDVYEEFGGKHCSDVIRQSWKAIRSKAKNDTGRADLSKQFKLCNPIKDDEDIDKLLDWLANIYINLAMVNYPYPSNFLAPLPGHPVREFCARIPPKDTSEFADEDVITELSVALELYTNGTKTAKCNSIDVTVQDLGEKGWNFQSCTEMIMPMCSTDEDMFENYPWNFQSYSDDCFKQFGVRPANENVPLLLYGGKNIKSFSNIVFSNGLLDPWSSGGVLTNISSSVVAVLIPDGAHHFDLRARNENDTVSVVEARRFHIRQIQKWLDEYYFENILDPVIQQFSKHYQPVDNEIS